MKVRFIFACVIASVLMCVGGAMGQSSGASAPFVFFAQCGDPDQTFDPAVGSADRKSSYPGTWCGLESTDGKQTWDLDIPAPDVESKVEFRLSGYPAFDADSVEYAVLRFDVLYEPEAGSGTPRVPESVSFVDHESCGGLCTFTYTKGLREALVKAGRDERQWIALTLDLVSGIVDASEIDGRGNPVAGRCYPNIPLDLRDESTGRYPAKECRQILREASDGTLQGSLQWNGKVSYVSLTGRARKPSATKVMTVRSVEDQVGTSMLGSCVDLHAADGSHWKILSKSTPEAWVAEFVAVFDAPEAVRNAKEGLHINAILEFNGAAGGSAPGRYTLSVIDPGKQAPGNELTVFDDLLSTSGYKETKTRCEIKDIRRHIDASGRIRIRFSYRNNLKSIPIMNVVERFNSATVPSVQLDRLRIIVRVPE